VPTKNNFNKIALKIDGPIFDRNLGRLNFGYVILEDIVANQWLAKFPDKVIIVSPEEVATVYGNSQKK
jgi:hypothetical protein